MIGWASQRFGSRKGWMERECGAGYHCSNRSNFTQALRGSQITRYLRMGLREI